MIVICYSMSTVPPASAGCCLHTSLSYTSIYPFYLPTHLSTIPHLFTPPSLSIYFLPLRNSNTEEKSFSAYPCWHSRP